MNIRCAECSIGHYHALSPGSAFGTCLSCGHMVMIESDVAPYVSDGDVVVGTGGFLEVRRT